MIGKENCGFTARTSSDKIEDLLYLDHTNEEIEKFGFVAIQIQTIKNK